MKINAKPKQMEFLEAVIGGLPITRPPYWRYRRACLRYRQAAKRGPGAVQSRSSAWPPGTIQFSKTRNSTAKKQHSRPLQTIFQRTQTRSWAPSGPVRIFSNAANLRPRHGASSKVSKKQSSKARGQFQNSKLTNTQFPRIPNI